MKLLIGYAWTFMAVCLVLEALSGQLLFANLQGVGAASRLAFAIGGLVGDLPVVVLVGLIAMAVLRLGFNHKIGVRLAAVSVGIGCIANIVIIHPILLHLYA